MNSNVKARILMTLTLLLVFCSIARADETDLYWSTFLGGTQDDLGIGIATDGSGYIYVTGTTGSDDFPTTTGAFDGTYNGADYYGDVFVVKFNTMGNALEYATFLGGIRNDIGSDIAVDNYGNPTAQTYTNYTTIPIPIGDFPIQPGRAYRVEVTADAAWPSSSKVVRNWKRVLYSR